MIFVWSKSLTGRVRPQLWYVSLPTKGEGEPDSLKRIVQTHNVPDSLLPTLDALPDGVARLDYLAKIFPYEIADNSTNEVDSEPTLKQVEGAIDAAVDKYRQRMRAFDGQTAAIDKENGTHV